MSWLSSTRPNAKIRQRNEYYFFTPERTEKGYLKLYSSEQVTVTSDEIKRPPPPTPGKTTYVRIIPREYILKLNPRKDFIFKTRLTYENTSYLLGTYPLGDVLSQNNFGYSDLITYAFISCGEPALDLETHLVILPMTTTTPVPKFKDSNILNKLTVAIQEVIDKTTSQHTHWSDFIIENKKKDLKIKVSIAFSDEALKRFTGSNVGKFKLPNVAIPNLEDIVDE